MTRHKNDSVHRIAGEHLNLQSLETRNSDSLDFTDQAVWDLRAALEAAYDAGMEAGQQAAS